jgi:hypothetical protein
MSTSEIDKTNWGIREIANQGLTFWKVPDGFQSRPMVGYDVMNQQIDPSGLIHHLPNTYATVTTPPEEKPGKLMLTELIKMKTIKE